ncbi:hypothetical protein [Palleronia sp. LCG004]|uniref:hypothetical protein n=1 Tax=Palleronia sp. LCG004 TaxID=3079304 RepID=UPI002943CC2B|nr:hypothetical protein [Palleronia sp. LCG004]WOI57670.1 hypothetical protein RVY76_15585 [Palleronia sp. LCG004]
MQLPVQATTAKELALNGPVRVHGKSFTGVSPCRTTWIYVRPFVRRTFSLADALSTFEVADDRSRSIKTQIAFTDA